MHHGAHGAHGVAFEGRGNVVAAHLHAHHKFVGAAEGHRAEARHRFGQGQRGAAVQDAEGLARAVVDGHGGFDALVREVGVLYAQIAHQAVGGLCVEAVQGHLRGANVGQDELLDGLGHAVFVGRGGRAVGTYLDRLGRVAHGHAHARQLEHGHVGRAVADGHHLVAAEAQLFEQDAQRVGLLDGAGHHFEEERLGTEHVELAGQALFPVGFQSAEGLFVVAHEDAFVRGEVDGRGQVGGFLDFQAVERRFGLHVRVGGVVGEQAVAVVGEQGEAVLARLLFEIGQHGRVDPPLEDDVSVRRVDDDSAVVGHHKAAVQPQFERLRQRHEAMHGPPRGQHDAHAELLRLAQGRHGALAHGFLFAQQRSVDVEYQ